MTQLLVPKSPYVWKKLGGWGCGSEQAPLMMKYDFFYTINKNIIEQYIKGSLNHSNSMLNSLNGPLIYKPKQ